MIINHIELLSSVPHIPVLPSNLESYIRLVCYYKIETT